jgi:vacuolar-type H+-ATPase subunit I/STV1
MVIKFMKNIKFYLSALFLLVLWLLPNLSNAQSLEDLLVQREQAFRNIQHFYGRNTAFFGGKSRRDLEIIVKEMEKLIALDNRIIDLVQQQKSEISQQHQALSLKTDTLERQKELEELVRQRIERTLFDLNRQISNLESANRLLRKQLDQARQDILELNRQKSGNVQYTGLFMMFFVIFLVSTIVLGIMLYRERQKSA